jgi:hypothetical protein
MAFVCLGVAALAVLYEYLNYADLTLLNKTIKRQQLMHTTQQQQQQQQHQHQTAPIICYNTFDNRIKIYVTEDESDETRAREQQLEMTQTCSTSQDLSVCDLGGVFSSSKEPILGDSEEASATKLLSANT